MNHCPLKYVILGAGGTGGAVGAYMAKAGKDVTLIARGAHLSAIQERGLHVIRPKDEFTVFPICATDMEHYEGHPDVILVCVKGYSVKETIPFIRRIAKPETIVIPILNIYGTGGAMQRELPDLLVTDGCIYVASEIKEPGCIWMKGEILRVIFGCRKNDREAAVLSCGQKRGEVQKRLLQVEKDLKDSGILGILSEHIERDTLLKFSYVSPQSACGIYYGVSAGAIQQPGEIRDCFAELIREIDLLGKAMGIVFEEDIVARNLKILDEIDPSMTTSLQRDLAAGKQSELQGQIFEVLEMAKKAGVSLPMYEKIAEEIKRRRYEP